MRTTMRTIRPDGAVKEKLRYSYTRSHNMDEAQSQTPPFSAYVTNQVEGQPPKATTTVEEELDMRNRTTLTETAAATWELKHLTDNGKVTPHQILYIAVEQEHIRHARPR